MAKKRFFPSLVLTVERVDKKPFSFKWHFVNTFFAFCLLLVSMFLFTNIVTSHAGFYLKPFDGVVQRFYPADLIVVNPGDRTFEEILFVAVHEFGHWWWYNHLSEADRALFFDIHNQTEVFPWLPFSGDYASESVGEDFAESFALSVVCGVDPSRLLLFGDGGVRRDFFVDRVDSAAGAISFNLVDVSVPFNEV